MWCRSVKTAILSLMPVVVPIFPDRTLEHRMPAITCRWVKGKKLWWRCRPCYQKHVERQADEEHVRTQRGMVEAIRFERVDSGMRASKDPPFSSSLASR